MNNSDNIFHEIGEIKGRLGAVEQTVSRIESKLDNFGAVPLETFEKYREESEARFGDCESRLESLEKRAIKEDSSFMRKIGNSFEKRLAGWIVALIFSIIIYWVFATQQQQVHNLINEVNLMRSK